MGLVAPIGCVARTSESHTVGILGSYEDGTEKETFGVVSHHTGFVVHQADVTVTLVIVAAVDDTITIVGVPPCTMLGPDGFM